MRLIDAERLKTVLEKNFGHTGGADVIKQLIDVQPTVDAVPVVRCKDCKYNLDGLCDQISLEWHLFYVKDDEYCAWARRKEE